MALAPLVDTHCTNNKYNYNILTRSLLSVIIVSIAFSNESHGNEVKGGEAGLTFGYYHTFVQSPKKYGLHFTDKYYLRETPFILFELFPKTRLDSQHKKRIGVRVQYLSVRRMSYTHSKYFLNEYEKINRVYTMFSVWPVFQQLLREYAHSYFALDASAGLSVVSSHAVSNLWDYCDAVFCSDSNVHFGITGRIKMVLKVNKKNANPSRVWLSIPTW